MASPLEVEAACTWQLHILQSELRPRKWIYWKLSLYPVPTWGTVWTVVEKKTHVTIQRMRLKVCWTALNQRHQLEQEQMSAVQMRSTGKVLLTCWISLIYTFFGVTISLSQKSPWNVNSKYSFLFFPILTYFWVTALDALIMIFYGRFRILIFFLNNFFITRKWAFSDTGCRLFLCLS